MKMKLAENIKKYRKERNLTQEQLAEALSVTTGAVYKWESEKSLPEVGMLMLLSYTGVFRYQAENYKLEASQA